MSYGNSSMPRGKIMDLGSVRESVFSRSRRSVADIRGLDQAVKHKTVNRRVIYSGLRTQPQ
jgi:hypothetical protein